MIAIINYGLGNTQAILSIYNRLNIPAVLADTPKKIEAADHLILPGVGAFDWAMQSLDSAGLRQTLDQVVTVDKRPILGICVGMQMMATVSEEGDRPGLGWIDAEVKRFAFVPDKGRMMLPHMGWNDIELHRESALMGGLEEEARFYFLHSYFFAPRQEDIIVATTDYGSPFACAVQAGNCYGVQFHPEKSHGWGIQLLKNFAEI